MNEASFTGWLKDLVAEHVEEDGANLESIESFIEIPSTAGFVVRIDGEEFTVRVSQIRRVR